MNSEFGVTPEGFVIKRLQEVKSSLEARFIAEFSDINLDPASVAGQIVGIFSKVLEDEWENSQDVYLSQYPNSATGISLDNVVMLNGLTRLPATRTNVIGVATGIEGTLIQAGGLARIPDTGDTFQVVNNTTITRGAAAQASVQVVNPLVAGPYTVLINGRSYTFLRPIIQFSGPIQPGNTITVRINSVNVPTVTYAVSSVDTLNALGAAIIAALPADVASTSVLSNGLYLTPVVGSTITVNSVNINGVGAPTYSAQAAFPVDSAQVATHLAAQIDQSDVVFSTYPAGSNLRTIQITARDTRIPFLLNFNANMEVLQVASPAEYEAIEFGPIAAPVNSLTQILTPVAGFQSLNNLDAGITGRFAETDEELRLRRARSLRSVGYATVEAIRSRLLQEVSGVESVTIYENVTMIQSELLINFTSDFVTDNEIQVIIDGVSQGVIIFSVDQLTTITAVSNLIADNPDIESSVVTGIDNRTIEVNFESGEEVEIEFNISEGASQPTYNQTGGRPPKSFEVVIQGGADLAVAEKIWETKPAGIQTFGNVNNGAGVIITDSQGNPQVIHFTRAVSRYISVNVIITLNPQETFPVDGLSLIADSILAYGNTLGVGIDVFIQRVQAQVFTVPGVASADVELASTLSPNDVPVFSPSNIIIEDNEASVWDINRINVSL